MKQPSPPKHPLNNNRYETWLAEFSGYTAQVTRRKIELWLEQFKLEDRDTAARVLDATLFFGSEHIRSHFRQGLASIPGWNVDPNQRSGRWVFTAFSGSSGESGDSMIHQFRLANGLSLKKFNELFVHRSELVGLKLGPDDTVVLVDDFSATGRQAIEAWPTYAELLSLQPRIYLLLVAATEDAVEKVRQETDLEILAGSVLLKRSNLFSADCIYFDENEKSLIESYCKKLDRRNPKGSGNAGLLVVFSHRCPNNSLPILHTSKGEWTALFPRHLN